MAADFACPSEYSSLVRMYQIHPHHRNGHPHKSQWTISELEEQACYAATVTAAWILDRRGWGLHFANGQLDWLGTDKFGVRRLFVAKFVGSRNDDWHGYPADHMRRAQDIPPTEILGMWLQGGVLPPAKIRKLMKGQPCNL